MFNLRATGGALFFGVPHRGMDNSALLSVIGSQANREFLESLRIGSPELEKQSQMFSSVSALDGSVIFSFFETCISGTAKMVSFLPTFHLDHSRSVLNLV
jgi:protein SERAC1